MEIHNEIMNPNGFPMELGRPFGFLEVNRALCQERPGRQVAIGLTG